MTICHDEFSLHRDGVCVNLQEQTYVKEDTVHKLRESMVSSKYDGPKQG